MDVIENEVKKISKFIATNDFTWGKSGNLSLCDKHGKKYITKSGANIKNLKNTDMVTLDGAEKGKKSKEFKFHQVVYEVSNAKYCIHLSPFYTTLHSCSNTPLKTKLFIESTYFLSNVDYVDYFNPGSDELATAIGKKAQKSNVIIMKNHGSLIFDDNLDDLLETIEVLENVCKMNCLNSNLTEMSNEDILYLTKSGKYKKPKELWNETRDNS